MKITLNRLIDAAIILAIILFLLNYYQPSLLLSKTTTDGGDTGSHYYAWYYFHTYLVPHLQIFGWSPGWYAGFPMLQYYFPFPYMLMELLLPIVGSKVAFKLITAFGVFLLPIATYFALDALDFEFPTPIIGAVLMMLILFYEKITIWGGNIGSTLAGEFPYQISLGLFVLFIAYLYRSIFITKKISIKAILLLFSLILTHIITLIVAVLSAGFFFIPFEFDFQKRKLEFAELSNRLLILILTFGTGIMLSSFWLLPAIADIEYTTNYAAFYPFLNSYLTSSILFLILGALFASIYGIYKRDKRILYLDFAFLVTMLLYYFGPNYFNAINIRFLPISIVICAMLCAIFLGKTINLLPSFLVKIAPLLIAGAILTFLFYSITFTPSWIKWNYSGYESRTTYPEFTAINSFISKLPGNARVGFEHDNGEYGEFGTERAFEMLPYFTGKSTIEGLYMQSTPSSPYIFYSQCEYSAVCSQPIPNVNYPTFNLEKGTEHLALWNVQYLIQTSDKLKAALANNSDWKEIARFGRYGIYNLTTNNGNYVVPEQQVVWSTKNNWKEKSMEWYTSNMSNFIVYSDSAPITSKPYSGNCIENESITANQISFYTNCIGTAHLIKVSYFPNWQAVSGADKVYLTSPSLMMVFPTSHYVVLKYQNTASNNIGLILSAIALVLLMVFAFIKIKTRSLKVKRVFEHKK